MANSPAIRPTDWLRRARSRWFFWRSRSRVVRSGPGHTCEFHDSLLSHCRIEMFGENNRLEVLPGSRAWDVTFRLIGKNLHCQIGSDARLHGGHYLLEDQGSRLLIGNGCTLYAPMCVVHEGGLISIGDRSMFAYNCDLRNSDGHSILDATTQVRINPPRDIRLGQHVWLGMQAQILKGVTIGDNVIVGARSVVTKDVGAGSLVAGLPARVLRENINWDERRL